MNAAARGSETRSQWLFSPTASSSLKSWLVFILDQASNGAARTAEGIFAKNREGGTTR